MQYLNAQKFTGFPLRPLSSVLLLIIGLIAITLTPRTGQAIEFKASPQLTLKKHRKQHASFLHRKPMSASGMGAASMEKNISSV